ncbi:hypothetical protein [Bdellovibrio sp. HCB-162]|uniref:hypothetical protein n=1 Tax=Bdellovibrio sp. HCB-162 TaxID=3394234 RepID=UPI0039BC809C
MKKFILTTLLLTLSACAPGGGGSSNTHTKSVIINGKTPREYYNQFLYKTSGECSKGTLYHHFVHSKDIVLGKTESGNPILGELYVFLIDENNFSADLLEKEVLSYEENGYSYREHAFKSLKGRYEINDNGDILLEGLGSGRALKYNKSPAIDFAFSSYSIEELHGKTSILGLSSSSNPFMGRGHWTDKACE